MVELGKYYLRDADPTPGAQPYTHSVPYDSIKDAEAAQERDPTLKNLLPFHCELDGNRVSLVYRSVTGIEVRCHLVN